MVQTEENYFNLSQKEWEGYFRAATSFGWVPDGTGVFEKYNAYGEYEYDFVDYDPFYFLESTQKLSKYEAEEMAIALTKYLKHRASIKLESTQKVDEKFLKSIKDSKIEEEEEEDNLRMKDFIAFLRKKRVKIFVAQD